MLFEDINHFIHSVINTHERNARKITVDIWSFMSIHLLKNGTCILILVSNWKYNITISMKHAIPIRSWKYFIYMCLSKNQITLSINAMITTSRKVPIDTVTHIWACSTNFGTRYSTQTFSARWTSQNVIKLNGMVINFNNHLKRSYTTRKTHHKIKRNGIFWIQFGGSKVIG